MKRGFEHDGYYQRRAVRQQDRKENESISSYASDRLPAIAQQLLEAVGQ